MGLFSGKKSAAIVLLVSMLGTLGPLPLSGKADSTVHAEDSFERYGNFEDWEGSAVNQAAVSNRLELIKAVNRDGKLYVMAKGEDMEASKTLYINADNEASTGESVPGWKDSAGIDYKVIDRVLFKYDNGSWAALGDIMLSESESVAEYEIDGALLSDGGGVTSKMKLGLASNGSMLPELGELMMTVQPPSQGGAQSEAPAEPADLAIDGDGSEWVDVPVLLQSADGKTTVKYSASADSLNVLIEGKIDNGEFPDLWEHLLIDTDRNPGTGNTMWAWADKLGSELLVQSGLLYQAGASGSWTQAATGLLYERSGTGDAKTIEWSLPIAELNVGAAKSVRIAFLSNSYAMPDAAGDPMEISLVSKPRIAVDGDGADWERVAPLAVTADGLTTVKAFARDEQLYALITGRIENSEFPNIWEHFFIDTDKNPSTGTSSWAWAGKLGAEFLVQTALLYESNGSGGWTQTAAAFPYQSTGTGDAKTIEWSLPLSELGLGTEQSIHAGFLSNSYVAPDASGDPAMISLRENAVSIVADGNDDDWNEVETGAASSASPYELRAVMDERKLYVRVIGDRLDLRNAYYIDSDNDDATGEPSAYWAEGGFDYKIEKGSLFAYSEQNGQWEERGPVHIAVGDNWIEMNVYLDQIGLPAGPAPIEIGYMNRGMLQLPAAGSPPLTVDSIVQTHEVSSDVYYPRQSFELLNNPYMGWVAWAKDANRPYGTPYEQQHSLVYAGITWSELEPVKGQFDWEAIEQKYQFDYWSSQGKRINLRIVLDTPTSDPAHMDIPDWLYDSLEAEGNAGTWYDTAEIGSGFSPNYNSPLLLAEHERLIAAVAERYDNDERIAFVQLGSLGHWGEWHTWPIGSGVFPKLAVSDQYVAHYSEAFANKQIGMRKPFPIASEQRLGLFNDVFGIKSSTDEWVGWTRGGWTGIGEFVDDPAEAGDKLAESAMPDFWKYAYSGGEFANGNPESWMTDDAMMETLRQMRESHTSWLGPSSPARTAYGTDIQSNIETMHKMMGYRYVIEAVKHQPSAKRGKSLSIQTVVNNKGVAPFYQDWKLEYSLADGNGDVVFKQLQAADLLALLPGRHLLSDSLDLPATLAAGRYKLLLAVIDPATNEPGMKLAIEGERPDGRYEVGSLQIVSSSNGGGSGEGTGAVETNDDLVQHINEPVLTDSKLNITMPENKTSIELPLGAPSMKDNPAIAVTRGAMRFEIPGELLAQARGLAASGAKAAQLVIGIAKKDGAVDELAAYAARSGARLRAPAEAFVFSIAVKTGNEVKPLFTYDEPVVISVQPTGDWDRDLINLYRFREKDSDRSLEAVFAVLTDGILSARISEPGVYQWLSYEKSYRDVAAGHWASSSIAALSAKQVLNGVKEGVFEPGRAITRAEFAVLLARLLELKPAMDDTDAPKAFTDIPPHAWYADKVAAVRSAGLVSGDNGAAFRPGAALSREELAVLLVKAAERAAGGKLTLPVSGERKLPYEDEGSISIWAADAVRQARELSLLIGDDAGFFHPQGGVTRAEAAQAALHLFMFLQK
ncbi:S-layer homology domain-containing protein [Paenibacillus sp. 2TAB19]|uniref:S-layer homology domain-containing protein n=1 Tax=Paenibacillus sp. 2TAB19 TaxID=3233003 RepID=UPI003F97AB15